MSEQYYDSNIKENVPVVSTTLSYKDVFGAWKVRWGIERMDYKVNPGIYAIGKATNHLFW